jgi:hypothetical protein
VSRKIVNIQRRQTALVANGSLLHGVNVGDKKIYLLSLAIPDAY